MRRPALFAVALSLLCASGATAQNQPGYPHGFLFGAWVGGMLPAPTTLNALECQASPTVLFTRDVIFRANPFNATYAQSLVETVRDVGGGVEFRLVPIDAPSAALQGLLGAAGSVAEGVGFGCGDRAVLRVQRRGANEISFPNCKEFPYPLVRCPGP